MRSIRVLACLVAVAALFACDDGGGPSTPTTTQASARAGFGGPAAASPVVAEVSGETFFQTPSKNIFCVLNDSIARCDIINKSWTPPPKPADCELDWGFGMYLHAGKAEMNCTGDSLIGTAKQTLAYGKAYRSGTVVCDSESTGLTCRDEQTGRGFMLSMARYSIF